MIELRSVGFGDGILHDVSTVFRPGELTAMIGPNGAGKTTLLQVIAGLRKPASGGVLIDGIDIDELGLERLAQRRAYLSPDTTNQIPFTVRQVVEMGRFPWGRYGDTDATTVPLETMGLLDLADRRLPTLSTGEAKRVHLARLLAQDTPILLLDEVLAGLDLGQAAMIVRRLKSEAQAGRTVVAVVHDLSLAASMADRMLVMSEGAVVFDGPPSGAMDPDLLGRVFKTPVEITARPDGRYLVWPSYE